MAHPLQAESVLEVAISSSVVLMPGACLITAEALPLAMRPLVVPEQASVADRLAAV